MAAGAMAVYGKGFTKRFNKAKRRIKKFFKGKSRYNNTNSKGYSTRSSGLNKGFITAQPFSPQKFCQVVYADTFTLQTGVSGLFGTERVFALNGLYDPDLTGVGHQPLGFDQLMAIYRKYKVFGAKVILTYTNPSADGVAVGYKISVPGDADALGGMSYGKAREQASIRVKEVNDTGSQVVIQSFYLPMHTGIQITKEQFRAEIDRYAGDASANPAAGPYLRVAAANPALVDDLSIKLRVKIIFFTKFYQRKPLEQS